MSEKDNLDIRGKKIAAGKIILGGEVEHSDAEAILAYEATSSKIDREDAAFRKSEKEKSGLLKN